MMVRGRAWWLYSLLNSIFLEQSVTTTPLTCLCTGLLHLPEYLSLSFVIPFYSDFSISFFVIEGKALCLLCYILEKQRRLVA